MSIMFTVLLVFEYFLDFIPLDSFQSLSAALGSTERVTVSSLLTFDDVRYSVSLLEKNGEFLQRGD